MSRRVAREVVLQSLFQIDFTACEAEQALNSSLAEHDEFIYLEETECELAEELQVKKASCLKAKAYAEAVLNGVWQTWQKSMLNLANLQLIGL